MSEGSARLLIEPNGDVTVVYFLDSAILDEENIGCLGAQLAQLVEQKPKIKLLINFEKVEYLSSAVLGKLVAIHKKVAAVKGQFKLCGIKDNIMEVFKVTQLDKLFDVHPDELRAIGSFKTLQ